MIKQAMTIAVLTLLAACGGGGGGGGIDPPIVKPDVLLVVTVCSGPCIQTPNRIGHAGVQIDNGAVLEANNAGVVQTRVVRGAHNLKVTADGFGPSSELIDASRDLRKDVILVRTAPPISPISVSGQIFTRNGLPWRWKGISAFKLARLHADGQNIDSFLNAYEGFNVLRIFDYVPWPGTGWESPTPAQTLAFINYVGQRGWYVEIVLLTDDNSARIDHARRLVEALKAARPPNVVFEIGNEPNTNKHIDTTVLWSTLDASNFLYSSGDYDDSPKFFGRFGTAHTPRDSEWPRKAHDLREYWTGGGPSRPTDPAHKVPWVGDEPIRPDQAGQPPVMTRADDYTAYFATASILGAGATFHCGSCRFGEIPNADEAEMAKAALRGLNQFGENGPTNGPYERIDEQGATLRTYKVGNYIVRIRPTNGIMFP